MFKLLMVGTMGLAAVVVSGPVEPQTTSETVRRLQAGMYRMEQRVEALEAIAARESPSFADAEAAMVPPPAAAPAGTTSAPRYVMQLDGLGTLEPNPDAYDDVDRLQKEVDALKRTVDSQVRAASSSMGRSTSGSYRSGRSNHISREGRAKSEMVGKYKSQLRAKEGELKKLQRDLETPRQIIIGNWGGKIITLETTRDSSRTLDRIMTGEYLTWSGRRVHEDQDSQDWVVNSVRKVDPNDLPQEGRR